MEEVEESRRNIFPKLRSLDLDLEAPDEPETHPGNGCVGYDLIYSSELFPNLRAGLAYQKVASLMSQLRPGGRLLITNVGTGSKHAACPRCCHGVWHQRTEEEIAALTSDVAPQSIAGQVFFRDNTGTSILLEVHKSIASGCPPQLS